MVLKKGQRLDITLYSSTPEYYQNKTVTTIKFLSHAMIVSNDPYVASFDTITRDEYKKRNYKKSEWRYNVYQEGFDSDCEIVMGKLEYPPNDTLLYSSIHEVDIVKGSTIYKFGYYMYCTGLSLIGIAPFTGIHEERYRWNVFATTVTSGATLGIIGALISMKHDNSIENFPQFTRKIK